MLILLLLLLDACGGGRGLGVDPGRDAMAITASMYMHGTGPANNPPVLFLDKSAPTGGTEKYRDSASINFAGGNPWKEVGIWTAAPNMTGGDLIALQQLDVWLGLKNSDDQGTKFDLRAEIRKNGSTVATGETYTITGVTRNANQAKEVFVALSSLSEHFDGSSDQLSVRILTRIGTDGHGNFGGGHSNATGLRLYFDSTDRASCFGTTQNTGPSASAHATPVSGTAPLAVDLDAAGSNDPDGTLIKWEWDLLGDGNFADYTISGGVASYTYINGGVYHPVLRVTDDSGATATATLSIDVNARPTAGASGSPDLGYPPMEVHFDGSTSADSDGTITKFEWDFGEGGGYVDFGTVPTVDHTYNSAGNYTAMLRVTDDDGATATAAVSIDTTVEPPNQSPIADGDVTPTYGTQPLSVEFDGSASNDPDGTIVMWEWDLGDGSGFHDYTSTMGVLEFTYIDYGDKSVVLRVTDNDNAVATQSFSVHVNAQPNALGDGFPSSGNAPLLVAFNASGSGDPDGSIVQWEWDFGQGGGFEDFTGSSGSASHAYNAPGTYIATLRITDNEGGQDIFNLTINVNFPPTAALSANPLSGTIPLTVDFDASGSSDPDGPISKYEWDWDGNGTYDFDSDVDATVQHTYSAAGTYHATVRVTDGGGLPDTESVTIQANAPPVIDWVHTVGFSGNDFGAGSAMDAAGNVYVVGTTSTNTFGGTDAFLAKYNSSGVLQPGWPRHFGEAGNERGLDIEIDHAGNILIAGISDSFPAGGTGGDDFFIVKYNQNGDPLWRKSIGTPATEDTSPQCIAIDEFDDVYVGCTTTYSGTYASISKLDGSNGHFFWTKLIGGQSGHSFGSIAVNLDGVYAFGVRADDSSFPFNNLYLIKMNRTTGDGLWQRQLQILGDHFSDARGLALTYHNNVERVYATASIVTGRTDGYIFTVTGDGNGSVTGRRWTEFPDKFLDDVAVDETSGDVYALGGQPGVSDTCLFKFSGETLNMLGAERWTGPTASIRGELLRDPADGRLVVTGSAANNTGSWQAFSPPTVDQGTAYINNTAIVNSFMNFVEAPGAFDTMTGATEDTGAGGSEMFVAKRLLGDNPVPADWTHSWGGSSEERLHDLSLSGTSIAVAGEAISGTLGAVVMKSDTSGSFQWARKYSTSGSNFAYYGVAQDGSSGNVYAVGRYFPGATGLVVQYTPTGTLGWQRGLQGPAGTVILNNLAVSSSGTIGCVGRAFMSGNYHQYAALLDSAGTLMWQSTFGSANSDECYGVCFDSGGTMYVAGKVNDFTATVTAFNPSGVQLWVRSVGPGGLHSFRDIAVATDGSLYLCGEGQPPAGFSAIAGHMTSSGSWLGGTWWNGVSNFDDQLHLALAPNQTCYVTSNNGSPGSTFKLDVARFNSSLGGVSVNRWTTGSSMDIGCGIASDSTGIYLGGQGQNNSGAWSVLSGTFQNATALSATAYSPVVYSTGGPVVTLSGSSTNISIATDTGGGAMDFLTARRAMP